MLQFILWIAALVNCCVGLNWNQLRGQHFRASALLIPPFIFKVNQGNGSNFDGLTKQLLDFVFHSSVNASYEFVIVDPKTVKENGYVLACINQLLNGEVDVSTLGYIPTAERFRLMDYSGPVLIPQNVMAVPYPKEKFKFAGIVRPFQPQVWYIFLLTLGLLVTVLSVLSKWYQKYLTSNEVRPRSLNDHIGDNAIYVLTVLIGNGEYYRGRHLWLRLVLLSWCLMCVVIINAYTGNLTSYLTLPAMESSPNSFEELALRKDLNLAVAKNSILADIILKSPTEPLKTLGDQLRHRPENLFHDRADMLDLIATHRKVTVLATSAAIQMVNDGLKKYKECRVTYSKPLSLYLLYVYSFPKNWPYKDAFNSRLQYIWDMGLLDQWLRMYTKQPNQCLLKKKEPPRKATMKLEDFSGAFVLLAAGFSLSLLGFLLEVLAGKMQYVA